MRFYRSYMFDVVVVALLHATCQDEMTVYVCVPVAKTRYGWRKSDPLIYKSNTCATRKQSFHSIDGFIDFFSIFFK